MKILQETLEATLMEIVAEEDSVGSLDELNATIAETIPDIAESTAESMLAKIKDDAATGLKEKWEYQQQFEERLRKHWGKPLELLDLFISLATEAGGEFNKAFSDEAARSNDPMFKALTLLHARACQVASATLVLLRSGFADDAHARWRALHEIAVVALFIGECGRNFHTRASWTTTSVRNGKAYSYELTTPRRYYMCNGTQSLRLRCREKPYIRAEQLEEPIWSEVKRVLQNPDLIVAGIAALDSQEGGGMEEEIAQAERDLRSIQMEEDRAIRLFVSGKITEAQLDLQRRFITERLESARAKLDDYRAQEASGTEKRRLMEEVLAWAREFGHGLDELTPEERHDYLQMLVEQVIIDRDNNVNITLAIPIDDDSPDPDSPDPESPQLQPESVSIGSQEPSR